MAHRLVRVASAAEEEDVVAEVVAGDAVIQLTGLPLLPVRQVAIKRGALAPVALAVRRALLLPVQPWLPQIKAGADKVGNLPLLGNRDRTAAVVDVAVGSRVSPVPFAAASGWQTSWMSILATSSPRFPILT